MDFTDDFLVEDPLTFGYFLKGEFFKYLQVWNSFLVIFVSPSLVCLNFLEWISLILVCLNYSGIFRIFFACVLAGLEFAVLVYFLKTRLEVSVPVYVFIFFYRGSRAVSYLVLFVLFRFVGT